MRIIKSRTPEWGLVLISCAMLAGCASGQPTKTETTTTSSRKTTQAPQQAARQPNQQAGTVANGEQIGGTTTNLNQLPIGKTTEQQPGSLNFQEQRQVVTTETQNRTLPTVNETTTKADINRMTASDFVALGLPRNVADNIIKARENRGGEFSSVDELKQVPGMSTAWLDKNAQKLAVGDVSSGPSGTFGTG